MSNGCLSNAKNPILWRESKSTGKSSLSVMYLVNIVAAAIVVCAMHEKLLATSSNLLPFWEWWTLAALMAGSAYHSLIRIRLERTRGTLELLRSTPLVPGALLSGQVRMALTWTTRALPLWALWALWIVSAGADNAVLRAAVLLPLIFLVAIAGSLMGVRLALAPAGSNWMALGGALGLLALVLMPAGFDSLTGSLQSMVVTSPADGGCACACLQSLCYGSWNVIGFGSIVAWLAVAGAWLWNADLRALSGFELNQSTDSSAMKRTQVPALWAAFDGWLLWPARLLRLDRNPFFMRERARSLRKLGRQPGIILTALVPTVIPFAVEKLLNLTPGVALAWCSVPIIFLWWMAGAETTRDAMTRELDGRTLDAVRVTPLDPQVALMGLVFGRLYPFVIGWLTSLPLWALYITRPGVSLVSIATFTLVLLGVGFTSAVGGLRASCTSLFLKGEDRYYSQAVSNPGLWAWPVATPLLVLFIVLPFHGMFEGLHLLGHYTHWVPFDVVTLFPTWFGNPDLLPVPTFLVAVVVHALVMRSALRTDLQVAWKSVQQAMDEEIRKPGAVA